MFVPLSDPPGHAQCGFVEVVAVITGVECKVHYFVLDLPHSHGCFVKAYPAETTEAFLDGHVSASPFWAGRQTQSVDRRPGYSGWAGSGRGQPPRHEAGAVHRGPPAGAASGAHPIPRVCAWTRATTSLRCAAPWTSSASPPTSGVEAKRLRPSKGSWVQSPPLGGGTHSQLAEPLPAHSDPLGQVSRQLHRLPSFRLCPHRHTTVAEQRRVESRQSRAGEVRRW